MLTLLLANSALKTVFNGKRPVSMFEMIKPVSRDM